jgi:hypothetical protein
MSVVTGRPNVTLDSGGTIQGGAGSRHAALADDTDSTYVRLDGVPFTVGFAEPTIPAGAIMLEWAIRMRTRKVGSGKRSAEFRWTDSDTSTDYKKFSVSWTNWTTVTYFEKSTSVPPTDFALRGYTYGTSYEKVEVTAAYLDFVYVAVPELSVVSPSGAITNQTAPAVEWSPVLDSDGGPQTHYHFKIFSAAEYGAGGFDPETSNATYDDGLALGGDTSSQPSEELADGTYRAYVKLAQTVNGELHWSDWEYSGFSIATDRPAVPAIVATGQPSEARIQLDVTTTLGDVSADYVEIERSLDGGTTWEEVRRRAIDADLPEDTFFDVASDVVRVWDYEAPIGTSALYRARAVHDFSPGYSRSAWSSTDDGSWESDLWWLKAADGTRLNVRPFSLPGLSRSARRSAHQPLGRETAIAVTDTRGPWTGEIVLETDDAAEQETLDELLSYAAPLLLQAPEDVHWTDRWLSFGDQERRWMVDKLAVQDTLERLNFIVVDRPEGLVADAPTSDAHIWPALDLYPAPDLYPS